MNQPVGGSPAKPKTGKTGADFGSAFDAFALPTGEIPAAFREAAVPVADRPDQIPELMRAARARLGDDARDNAQ
jgi:hypothetical protein